MSKKNKAIILAAVLCIVGLSAVSQMWIHSLADPAEQKYAIKEPEKQISEFGVYVGTLKEGTSYLIFGGVPTVELTFEGDRTFTAPEQMAKEAQMRINGTYQITFSTADPGLALTITARGK